MTDRTCSARRMGDQMHCVACRLVWDMNDPEPPPCGRVVRTDPTHAVDAVVYALGAAVPPRKRPPFVSGLARPPYARPFK
jgi:hypothetical protein